MNDFLDVLERDARSAPRPDLSHTIVIRSDGYGHVELQAPLQHKPLCLMTLAEAIKLVVAYQPAAVAPHTAAEMPPVPEAK